MMKICEQRQEERNGAISETAKALYEMIFYRELSKKCQAYGQTMNQYDLHIANRETTHGGMDAEDLMVSCKDNSNWQQ